MQYRIFVSYASDNRFYKSDQKLFDQFVDDLITEINQNDESIPREEIAFFAGRDIEAGHNWTADLAEALRTSRLLLAFYSPHYFASRWCGREVHVFQQRRQNWVRQANLVDPPQVIIPVMWVPCENKIPEALRHIQFVDDGFPSEYRKRGVRKVRELSLDTEYEEIKTALAMRVLDALKQPGLPAGEPLETMEGLPSAFATAAAAPRGHRPDEEADRSAFFVFAAASREELAGIKNTIEPHWGRSGWHWNPYHPALEKSVGALAQQAAGNKNLPFISLPCDDALVAQLKRAKRLKSPVVIVADPWSIRVESYRTVLEQYDELMLLNCALLVAWNDDDPETKDHKAALEQKLRETCPQKIAARLPGHYWAIRSAEELSSRLLTILDEITMRLIDAAEPEELRRARSPELEADASRQGISVALPSQLSNSTPAGPAA